MAHRITITAGKVKMSATLNDTPTAEAIWRALPLEANANRWGDEIYFEIPVQLAESEDARQDMAVGELGYWPVGAGFCIFFGPTPVSPGDQPRAYSKVNPFGKVDSDARLLRSIKDGETVRVERD